MKLSRTTPHWLCSVLLCAGACRSVLPSNSVQDVPAQFHGNEAHTQAELAAQVAKSLEELAANPSPRAAIDDAAYDLENYLRGRGYAHASVTWTLEGEDDQRRAHFVVHEGPRVRLRDLSLEGRPSVAPPSEELLGLVELPGSGALGARQSFYVEQRLEAGAARIAKALRERGWLQARATAQASNLSAGTAEVDAGILIDAGPRFLLQALPVVEARVLSNECARRLQHDGWNERVGQPYDPRWASTLEGSLLDLLAELGYPDATVDVQLAVHELTPLQSGVHLQCSVEEGPWVQVGEVQFRGNNKSRPSFLQSRFGVSAGARYDGSAVDSGVRKLYTTGLFESVQSRLIGTGNVRNLVLELVESESREIFVEPGFGSYELLRLRSGLREHNLFGSGRRVRAEAMVSQRSAEIELGLTDPWFLESPLSSQLSLEYERRKEPSFTSSSRGLAWLFSHQQTRAARTTFGYQFRRSELESATIDETELELQLGELNLASLRVGQRFDTLDDPFLPTRGQFLDLGLEHGAAALGSELDFLRATLGLAQYRELGPAWVAAGALRGGWIRPLGDDEEIPLQERFFNGGENSVRSYAESKLGPLDDDGDPIGGEGFATLNLELRRQLWRREVQIATFIDAGYTVLRHEDYFRPNGTTTGTAIGLGLRYLLPVGPLRIDFAYNPDPTAQEESFAVHFALGMAF